MCSRKTWPHLGIKFSKLVTSLRRKRKGGGGAFYSNKNAEIFETGSNGKEISREKLQKIQKYLHFRHRTIQPKIPGRKSNGAKISRKRFSKTLVYLRGVFLFFRNYVNSLFSFQRHWILLAAITASLTSHARKTDRNFALEYCHLSNAR